VLASEPLTSSAAVGQMDRHHSGSRTAFCVEDRPVQAAIQYRRCWLNRVLGIERGRDGEPSVNDFLMIDVLPIGDAFATRFNELPVHVPED
jgi:hypothetical protein